MADYLYGSAVLRARENAIIGRERLERLLGIGSVSAAYTLLWEYGVSLIYKEDGEEVDREATLSSILQAAYGTVSELAEGSEALLLWCYPYDCNNIKAVIKCRARNADPASMLFDFGTVDRDVIVKSVADGDFSALPPAMGEAAAEAIRAFSKTQNPQQVDLILDRACYRDMLRAAEESRNAFVLRLVRDKIDLLNLVITLRVRRMGDGELSRSWLRESLIPGGTVALSAWSTAFSGGEEAILAVLQGTAYADVSDAFRASDRTLSQLERITDDAWMETVKETKFMPIGIEAMTAFLIAHEYEVKNLRILLAGLQVGASRDALRERMRKSYV